MIKFYGTTWCGDCARSRAFLDENKIKFEFIDIEKDEEAGRFVEKVNNGNRSVPTIVFEDKSILVEPSNEELTKKIS